MPEASGEAEWPDVLGCAPVVCIFSYIFITGARMLIRGCHAPVLCTPGDGRNASQGTDLPRAVGKTTAAALWDTLAISAVQETGPRFLLYRKLR